MNLEFSRQIFEKYSKIKFHESPSSGAGLFHAADAATEGKTEMTKLIVPTTILRTHLKTGTEIGITQSKLLLHKMS